MTTLHLQTETGDSTALTLQHSSETLYIELESLRRVLQSMSLAWQGPASSQFQGEADTLLRQLLQQQSAIALLAERLQREIQEWETTDARGAAAFRSARLGGLWPGVWGSLPSSAGSGYMPLLFGALLPLTTALSVAPLLGGLPAWLSGLLERFFPPPAIISPLPDEPAAPEPGALHRLINEKLSAPPAEATPSAQPAAQENPPAVAPGAGYDLYHQVPVKSQGALYGSAACAPTSVSMVLDYYHAQNPDLPAVAPETLISMLDSGDGTPGSGVRLDLMTDDLGEIGYTNVTVRMDGNYDDLSSALKDGPVIVTSGVKLIGGQARDIQQAGSTVHAMVVKGLNADSVLVNDPWSGAEKVFSRETFSQMWANGSNGMYVIRP
jgi:uncharacterized protein YukE